MSELKLTIDQLKNYLGTGLELFIEETGEYDSCKESLIGIDGDVIRTDIDYSDINYCKPICYRLSDLDKEIEVNGERFAPLMCMSFDFQKRFEYEELNLKHNWIWNDVQRLLYWHFWPFGDEYFEQGLVIDKMTVK